MAGTTARGALPYPDAADPDDVPLDIKKLADGVAARFGLRDDYVAVAERGRFYRSFLFSQGG